MRTPAGLAAAAGILLLGACAVVGSDPGRVDGGVQQEEVDLVPVGYGTLRQDAVTLSLRRSDLLIKATPLSESVIRLTAPDTYDRLRELKEEHREDLIRRSGFADPALFLISFFSYEPDVAFEPEDVHLLNRGLRHRPLGIVPVTPGWGAQRLTQEETQMALYAYDPGVDLDQEMIVEYQDARRGGWERILQVLQAERARVLARARSAD